METVCVEVSAGLDVWTLDVATMATANVSISATDLTTTVYVLFASRDSIVLCIGCFLTIFQDNSTGHYSKDFEGLYVSASVVDSS